MNGQGRAWLLTICGAAGIGIAIAWACATGGSTTTDNASTAGSSNVAANTRRTVVARTGSLAADEDEGTRDAPLPPNGLEQPRSLTPQPRIAGPQANLRVAALPPTGNGLSTDSLQQAMQMLQQMPTEQQRQLQDLGKEMMSNPQAVQALQSGQLPPALADPKMLQNLGPVIESIRAQQAQNGVSAQQLLGVPAAPPAGTPVAPRDADEKPADELPPPEKTKPRNQISINDENGVEHVTLNFQDADLREVLDLLSEEAKLNILASESVNGVKVSAVLNNVDVDSALQAILRSTGFVSRRDGNFLYVGTAQDFNNLRTALDRVSTRVYRPNYVSAKELQALITPLLTPSVGKASVTLPASVGIALDSTNTGGDAPGHGDAVVVQDYEAVLLQIDEVIRELDRRPMQVAIEAMVLSVTLNDANQIGVNFQVLRDKQNVRFGSGQPRVNPLDGTGTPDGTTGGNTGQFLFTQGITPGALPGGLTFAFLDDTLGAFLTALETIGDINVIAQPRLLCLNKQKAEILIGSQIPYTTSTVTQTFTTQTVQFLDIGTQLRLRPFISVDGSIRMEVHPEISSAGQSVNNVPSKNVTQVTTNIMCYDGCTVIIGGLLEEDLSTNVSQIPFLGSLPYIGPLFRTKTDTTVRREILVLITPRIVYTPEYEEEARKIQGDFERRQTVARDNQTLLSRSHAARNFMRYAREHAEQGDLVKARRLADMAVKFDPSNREAIELRAELEDTPRKKHKEPLDIKVQRSLKATVPPTPNDPLTPLTPWAYRSTDGNASAPNPLDGEIVAPWLLDDLQGRPGGGTQLHPKDQGMPGYIRDIPQREVFDGSR